ncbi:hypothetical protein MTP99_002089 [Tenebrio molitor]|nr:hypothetical protein MTP99_002089 [Tenebrio molitor]
MGLEETPDCTDRCRSTQHGDIITAAISRRSVSDFDLCSYLNYICTCCESVKDSVGRTALHVAASCGRVSLVRWLVQNRHANINAKDDESGFTALHRSIFYGKINVAVELMKLGANTTLLDSNSLTLLDHAMMDGFVPESTNSGEFCGHGQGGRLGLGTQQTVIIPEMINFPETNHGEPITCTDVAISRDHSVFLCSDGNLYSCGVNTHRVLGLSPLPRKILVPTQLKHLSQEVKYVCAGQYHSVAWGPECLYTWGLNAGQILNFSETQIVAVDSSDGAISVCTKKGDIYVLHEYQCRKIASRQLNVIQVSIFGGKLNTSLGKDLTGEPNRELKVVALTNTGNLLLWQESDSQLCRCIYPLSRPIIVRQLSINNNGLLFVTKDGEAFQRRPPYKRFHAPEIIDSEMKQNMEPFLKNVTKTTTFTMSFFKWTTEVRHQEEDEKSSAMRPLQFNKMALSELCDVTSDYFNNLFSTRWRGTETTTVTLPCSRVLSSSVGVPLHRHPPYLNNKEQDHLFKLKKLFRSAAYPVSLLEVEKVVQKSGQKRRSRTHKSSLDASQKSLKEDVCDDNVIQFPDSPSDVSCDVHHVVPNRLRAIKLAEEKSNVKTTTVNLPIKIKSKLLIYTQIEDKAIEDLIKFYNAENVTDEFITVERVNMGAVAAPVWVQGNKKLES